MLPVPFGTSLISAFDEPVEIRLSAIVIAFPVVTKAVAVIDVAVNAATSNAPAVTVMPPDLSVPVAVVVPNLNVSVYSLTIIRLCLCFAYHIVISKVAVIDYCSSGRLN